MQTLGRILVVDDQDIVCEVLRTLLRREGFDVETTGDGENALARLHAKTYDVVIVDKNLPGMSGLDVLAQARSAQPHLEVIIITGYASLDSAIAALQAGACDYLFKPFSDLKEVADKVGRAAQKVRLVRDNRRLSHDLQLRNQLLEQTVEELRRSREQAISTARMAAIGEAATRLGRELTYPLEQATAHLQHLASQPASSASELGPALGELAQLREIVDEFLDCMHPRPPLLQPCDLTSLLGEVVAELAPVCEACGVRLETALPRQLGTIPLDARRIRQVLRHLLHNALDAMPKGGIVRAAAIASDDAVEIRIDDTGTAHATDPSSGNAFLLAIARRIAEEHSGRLELATHADGPGTCASLRLPRNAAHSAS